MQELLQCVNSGKGWAAERAGIAIDIAQALEHGEIDHAEARELLEDLIRADRLDAEADDMHLKSLLVTGVYAIIQVI